MSYLVWALLYLYGGVMLAAVLATFSQMPIWLALINLAGIISLFASPFNRLFLYLGLVILLISAALNGCVMFEKITISHLVTRGLLSLLISVLHYFFIIRK